jgi:hypothetical protein
MATFQGESQRFDQVQFGAGRQARTADVTGIPVNLWVHKDNMAFNVHSC